MEKESRERLDAALDALRELRTEEEYSGVLPHRFASCYMPAPRYLYAWDSLPGAHTCAVCNQKFGKLHATQIMLDEVSSYKCVDKEPTYDTHQILVDTWRFDTVSRACHSLRDLGYGAELELACTECILQKKAIPATFKFRASESNDYTVSYPLMTNEQGQKEGGMYCLPQAYRTAASFLEEVPRFTTIERVAFSTVKRGDIYTAVNLGRLEKNIRDEVERLKFKIDGGTNEVCILPSGSTETAFASQIVGARVYKDKRIAIEMRVDQWRSLDELCRIWLEKFRSSSTYEGRPWKVIFDALNRVLGLSLEE